MLYNLLPWDILLASLAGWVNQHQQRRCAPTAGKVPFLLFRFYGPEEPVFNKTFVLNDVELVK